MSITNITYLNQFMPNSMFYSNTALKTVFYFSDIIEITKFLSTLENDQAYVITFEFVMSWLNYEEDSPIIILSKPILTTKNSNPTLISKFLRERISLACDNYYLDDDILNMLSVQDGPGVIVNYSKIKLF